MSGDINLKLQDLLLCLTESPSLSVSLDETSSNASCSTESQSKGPATRESYRTASQTSKQKKKTGVMLPRVVLTPLKVNGAHMESASGEHGFGGVLVTSQISLSQSPVICVCLRISVTPAETE